jgi:NAD(P)-dependent dehydrogenase (short-subunit alcohol dehydrogenase family)
MHKNLEEKISLKNHVIVITGGCGLLGIKHAEAIIEADGIPILLDINNVVVDQSLSNLRKKYPGAEVDGFVTDITNEQSIVSVKEKIRLKFKTIDGLINNAANNPKMEKGGLSNWMRLENLPEKTWNDDIAVGLTGAFLCSRIFGGEMASQNGGVIINIASDLGIIAPDQRLYKKDGLTPDQQPVKPVTYSVIKHGLIGLTKYLATYWAEKNIRCNALCPGGVYNGQPDEFITKLTNLIPLGRMANIDEYKASIAFLCSEASSYMNGACLIMDGGRTCW